MLMLLLFAAVTVRLTLSILVLMLPLQVEFERPVDAKGNIEVWLQRLVDGMQDTVKQVR